LSLGRIFNRNGVLLATVAQEGMVRVPEFGE
jgi:acyl-CoA thioesterase